MFKGILWSFLPDHEYNSLSEIDPSVFWGKKLIIFDVDNTLFFSETTETSDEVVEWFKSVSEKYQCVCLSNSWTVSRRAAQIKHKLGCEVFISRRKKPSGHLFAEICEKYSVEPEQVVVVGDRVFTDVLFGNLNGATTVLVKPLASKEYLFIKLFRAIESVVSSILKRRGKNKKAARPSHSSAKQLMPRHGGAPLYDLLASGYTCVDMHVHTSYSKDAFGDIKEYLKIAKRRGIGLAIADHNEIDGAVYAVKHADGILIIPGIEVKTFNGVDVLVYFYSLGDLIEYHDKHIVPRKKKDDFVLDITVDEIIEFASKFKCLVGAPHPFEARICGIGDVIKNGLVSKESVDRISFVEVINGANTTARNRKAAKWARESGKKITGGSDAHVAFELGNVLTCAKLNSGEHFLDAIQREEARVVELSHHFTTHAVLFSLGLFKLLTYPKGFSRFFRMIRTCISTKNRINIRPGRATARLSN